MSPLEAADALAAAIEQRNSHPGTSFGVYIEPYLAAYRAARAEPQTVYLVTSGEYSDYSINAAYLDQAQAERHVELARQLSGSTYGQPEVEAWGIGAAAPELAKVYSVAGEVDDRKTVPAPKYSNEDDTVTHLTERQVEVMTMPGRGDTHVRHLRVNGRDLARVLKTWTEVAAQLVANMAAVPVVGWHDPEVREVEL